MSQVKINAINQADAEMSQHSVSETESFILARRDEHQNGSSLLTSSFFLIYCDPAS